MSGSTPADERLRHGWQRRHLLLALPGLAFAGRVLAQSPAQDSGPIRISGINHVGLTVSDMKRSVDFYQGLFGMPVTSRQGSTTNLRVGTGPQFFSLTSGAGPVRISHIGLGVPNFDADRLAATLGRLGFTPSATGGTDGVNLDGPLKMRLVNGTGGGPKELYFSDPDGVLYQLQDPKYCGGTGALGDTCKVEAAPAKGLMALRAWSHCTVFGSDGPRANKFFQDTFGLKVQSYQGPTAPSLGVGGATGVEFLMFAGAGGRGRGAGTAAGAAAPTGSINHLCWSMDNFQTDAVIKALESFGVKARVGNQTTPLVHYISMRMENRGGAKEGTAEMYFTDPDGLLMQLQDTKYCGGAGLLGEICPG